MRSPLRTTPADSSSARTVVREYHSPMRKWVGIAFLTSAIIAIVFSILCASTYKAFRETARQIKGSSADWESLFMGAAASAAFAIFITVLYHVTAVLLMLCSFRPLAHPHRKFGRAFVLASAIYSALHLLNITLQFQSYAPTNKAWRSTYAAAPKPALLNSCIALGYLSSALCALEAVLVWTWQDLPNLYQVDSSPAGA